MNNLNNWKCLELDISNKDIQGVLDLEPFTKLQKLCCQNNKITEIINIPETLIYLDCSNNKISKLNNSKHSSKLPDELNYLNCSNNKLAELDIPLLLTWLDCSNNRLKKLNNMSLLMSLNYLDCSSNRLKELARVPDNITLNCHNNLFEKMYYPFENISTEDLEDFFPETLKELIFSDKFNQELILPNALLHLRHITFGNNFNQDINNLSNIAPNLTHLTFGKNFNQEIYILSNTLEYLKFGGCFIQKINHFPETLKEITIRRNYEKYLSGEYTVDIYDEENEEENNEEENRETINDNQFKEQFVETQKKEIIDEEYCEYTVVKSKKKKSTKVIPEKEIINNNIQKENITTSKKSKSKKNIPEQEKLVKKTNTKPELFPEHIKINYFKYIKKIEYSDEEFGEIFLNDANIVVDNLIINSKYNSYKVEKEYRVYDFAKQFDLYHSDKYYKDNNCKYGTNETELFEESEYYCKCFKILSWTIDNLDLRDFFDGITEKYKTNNETSPIPQRLSTSDFD